MSGIIFTWSEAATALEELIEDIGLAEVPPLGVKAFVTRRLTGLATRFKVLQQWQHHRVQLDFGKKLLKIPDGFEIAATKLHSFHEGDSFLYTVLCRKKTAPAGYSGWVVWTYNSASGGFGHGNYFIKAHWRDALKEFNARGRWEETL